MWLYDHDLATVFVTCAQSPTLRAVVAAEGASEDKSALFNHPEFITTMLPKELQELRPSVVVTCFAGEDELTHIEQQVRQGASLLRARHAADGNA